MLSCMCPDGTQCRQRSPDAPDATRCDAWVQDAHYAHDAESRPGESGRNTTVSDAGHLFADVIILLKFLLCCLMIIQIAVERPTIYTNVHATSASLIKKYLPKY